jgi:hypothetical protein
MTSYMSLSDKGVFQYESRSWFESQTISGVRYRLTRMSVGRRIELARRLREIGRKIEFLEAGDDEREKLEGVALAAEIDRAYLEWGLDGIEGLEIDGEAAEIASLIERGPFALASEIIARIKSECGLTEAERKN